MKIVIISKNLDGYVLTIFVVVIFVVEDKIHIIMCCISLVFEFKIFIMCINVEIIKYLIFVEKKQNIIMSLNI